MNQVLNPFQWLQCCSQRYLPARVSITEVTENGSAYHVTGNECSLKKTSLRVANIKVALNISQNSCGSKQKKK